MPQKKKQFNNKKKNRTKKAPPPPDKCGLCSEALIAPGIDEEEVVPRLLCFCKGAFFCNEICRNEAIAAKKHKCSGIEKPHAHAFFEDYRETILEPKRRVDENNKLTLTEFVEYADRGQASFAFLAGVHFKNRISLDTAQSPSETGILAFKYLKQAAEAGIGMAMLSLGECYENGIGCKESLLLCRNWMWQAALLQIPGALNVLNSRSLVDWEHENQIQNMGAMYDDKLLMAGDSREVVGRNLGTLVATMHKELIDMGLVLPSFASTVPTCSVGHRPCSGTTKPVMIVGAKKLMDLANSVEIALNKFKMDKLKLSYGRHGMGLMQNGTPGTRGLDSPVLVVPPAPACNEQVGQTDLESWGDLARMVGFEVWCVHSQDDETVAVCEACIKEAQNRLHAVSVGSVVLTEEEVLLGRGRLAVWRGPDGKVRLEKFEDYGRGEVECALAALVACREDLARPLFVAQDPNFLWPLIQSHGCVRAALEYVAPHVDWNSKLGAVNDPVAQEPLVAGTKPGDKLRKCGNDLCLKLEPDEEVGTFSKCGQCQRRSYCSYECAKEDWMFHKHECTASCLGREPATQQAVPDKDNQRQTQGETLETPVSVGEAVVVYGLKSDPKLNGDVGVIMDEMTDRGRWPVNVVRYRRLALKPSNFYRLGVQIRAATSKKPAKFECSVHCLELCGQCSLDLTPANRLSKVRHSRNKALPRDETQRLVDLYFSNIVALDDNKTAAHRATMKYDNCFEECQGLAADNKRFILGSLLAAVHVIASSVSSGISEEGEMQLPVEVFVAVAGLSCFSARSDRACRALVSKHLEVLVDMVYSTKRKETPENRWF